MKTIDSTKRSIGVAFNKKREATIDLWAPKAETVSVCLPAKDRSLTLQKQDFGYYSLVTSLLQPGDLYKFVIDETESYPDPASLSQPNGVHEASQAADLSSFSWSDGDWNNIDLEQYIFYELHTGTFSPEGTFEDIEQKLAHLKNLGINAIEIMPVAQFPGDRNWGYDGVFPFAVQHSYGGAAGLQKLVDACHQQGIAVVLDVVYNHMGPEGNYLDAFGHYFTGKYQTPWGKAINFDDEWCDAVRHYFVENVLMWFRDFHIDALRLDAVHAIKDLGPKHILQQVKEEVDKLMLATGKRHYLVVEMDLNDNRYINPIEKCGFGMDAQWIDEFHHALRVASGNERTGYYEDFDGLQHLAKSYNDAYVYDGQFSPHRKKNFGVKATENTGKQFVVFSQNHDQVGNRMLGERTSQLVSPQMQKLMAGAVLCSPFLPMLFMGEEYSEPHPFLYFVSHTDAELAKAVREGRKREFAAFHLEGEAPDPNLHQTFDESKLQWHLLDQPFHKAMYDYYRFFIALRKAEPALHQLDRSTVAATAYSDQQLLVLTRGIGNNAICCLMNFSADQQQCTPPAGNWGTKLLDSAATQWNGPGETAPNEANALITLQPESIVLYRKK